MKTVQLLHFFHNGPTEISNERLSNLSPRSTGDEWISPWLSTGTPSDATEDPEVTFDVLEPPQISPSPATTTHT